MIKARKTRFNIVATAIVAVFLSACVISLPQVSHAEETLGPVEYLDYALTSPRAVYADDDLVVVTQSDKMVFFSVGMIYEKEFRSANKQIQRCGNFIYYLYNNLIYRVDVEDLTSSRVNTLGDEVGEIGANAFSINGNRLIALTTNGPVCYEDFVPAQLPYAFEGINVGLFGAGEVCIADDGDYYYVNGNVYRNGRKLFEAEVSYFSAVGKSVFFSNGSGIYKIENDAAVSVYVKEGLHGLCAYESAVLFIDGQTNKIMQISADGKDLSEFRFNVTIDTDAQVVFNSSPETVTVKTGVNVHLGELENGKFTFKETKKSSSPADYVLIGKEGDYAILFGNGKYAMVKLSDYDDKTQNTAITFEKGVVLHDCATYKTCVADGEQTLFGLKKGEEVTVTSAVEMNGVKYLAVQNSEGESAFVLAGEITENLRQSIPENTKRTAVKEGKDNTVIAVVMILLGAMVLSMAIFFLSIKKRYVKL